MNPGVFSKNKKSKCDICKLTAGYWAYSADNRTKSFPGQRTGENEKRNPWRGSRQRPAATERRTCLLLLCTHQGFPDGSDDKESTCSAGALGSIPGLGRSPGERNGNPLQYSCLENPMDRGAWRATVHGVAKSRTRLSDSHTHTCICTQLWLWDLSSSDGVEICPHPRARVLNCDSMDCSPPGFSIHGILQARILEWVACCPLGDLPNPGIEPSILCLLHWQVGSSPLVPPGKPHPHPKHMNACP